MSVVVPKGYSDRCRTHVSPYLAGYSNLQLDNVGKKIGQVLSLEDLKSSNDWFRMS